MGEEMRYFTPDIADLRVGYECEIQSSWGWQKGKWPDILFEDTLTGFQANDDLTKATKNTNLRVSYLTKEQIEKEGWEYKTTNKIRYWYEIESPENGGNWYGYYIYRAQLIHDPEMNYVKISFCFDCTEWETVFEGEVKDINTLRSVMKLLRMKTNK